MQFSRLYYDRVETLLKQAGRVQVIDSHGGVRGAFRSCREAEELTIADSDFGGVPVLLSKRRNGARPRLAAVAFARCRRLPDCLRRTGGA